MRASAVVLMSVFSSAVWADDAVSTFARPNVLDAYYADPTTRYGHDALGVGHEWGALMLELDKCPQCNLLTYETRSMTLSDDLVFEDLTPHLTDLDRDERAEVLVVESSLTEGSRLALWGPDGRIATGDFVGQRHRWLAVIGAADFDGDGEIEVAYIETPHLGKTLKIARLNGEHLEVIAQAPGLTNHHVGSDIIESAIILCGSHAVILTADADWSQVIATRFENGALMSNPAGPYQGPSSFQNLPDCN